MLVTLSGYRVDSRMAVRSTTKIVLDDYGLVRAVARRRGAGRRSGRGVVRSRCRGAHRADAAFSRPGARAARQDRPRASEFKSRASPLSRLIVSCGLTRSATRAAWREWSPDVSRRPRPRELDRKSLPAVCRGVQGRDDITVLAGAGLGPRPGQRGGVPPGRRGRGAGHISLSSMCLPGHHPAGRLHEAKRRPSASTGCADRIGRRIHHRVDVIEMAVLASNNGVLFGTA